MELAGRSVIVTGAARGIGRAIAEAFAGAGARVALADLGARADAAGDWAYRLASKDDLEGAAESVRRAGGEALGVEADVTDAASCDALVARAREAFGGVDVLVNNAGVIRVGAVAGYAEEDWDRTFAVNTKGVFLATRAALPALRERGGGVIVNIASIAGKRGYPGLAAYCASKFAVIGLTQSLAAELAPEIRVNAICPGLLATAMWLDHLSAGVAGAFGAEPGRPAFEAYVKANTPLGREQTPADIAEAALYLSRAENVTGIALNVAGGTEMW